jgi:hypothetical protein
VGLLEHSHSVADATQLDRRQTTGDRPADDADAQAPADALSLSVSIYPQPVLLPQLEHV